MNLRTLIQEEIKNISYSFDERDERTLEAMGYEYDISDDSYFSDYNGLSDVIIMIQKTGSKYIVRVIEDGKLIDSKSTSLFAEMISVVNAFETEFWKT